MEATWWLGEMEMILGLTDPVVESLLGRIGHRASWLRQMSQGLFQGIS
jgi:hypothetical protein